MGCLALLLVMIGAKAQRSDAVILYINTYKELAMQEMQRTGMPAAIKLAQGIHETEAGTSDLVKKSTTISALNAKPPGRATGYTTTTMPAANVFAATPIPKILTATNPIS